MLNCLVEQSYPSQNQKLMYQALVQSILLYGAETWTLNTQQTNKLLATEMDFWIRSARKSRKEKVRNGTIRAIMEVGKNILEVTEEKTAMMVWTCKKNARKQTATENFRMGTRGNAKKGKTQREMNRWSKTDHDKAWTDRRY
jgi:Zn-dependent M16 (insulinase) family peptidase